MQLGIDTHDMLIDQLIGLIAQSKLDWYVEHKRACDGHMKPGFKAIAVIPKRTKITPVEGLVIQEKALEADPDVLLGSHCACYYEQQCDQGCPT